MCFDLQDLEFFLAVADERSFTRAAADSHVTQPALSRKIQEMEKRFGVPLLERTTRKVQLTHAGEVLKRYASVIVDTCAEAEQAVLQCARDDDRVLGLGYGSRAQFEYLMKLIHVLHVDEPDVQINVIHGAAYEQLYLGQVDAALMMEGTVSGQEWLDCLKLDDSGLSVFFGKDDFPEDRTDISVSELADCHFIIPDSHKSDRGIQFRSLNEMIIQQMVQRGIREEAFQTGNDAQDFCTRILADHKMGIMPDSSKVVANGLVRSLPLREYRTGFGIVLAWRREDSENRYIRMLRKSAQVILKMI